MALAAMAMVVPDAAAAPSISGLEVRPTHFSPNGDGAQDSTEVLFTPVSAESTVTADVSVVRSSDDVTVAVLLSGTVLEAGTEARVPWIPGAIAEGLYRIEVGVSDGSGSASASADVSVDTTFPTVVIRDLSRNPFDPVVASLQFKVDVTSDSLTSTVLHVLQNGLVADTLGTTLGGGTRTVLWDGNLMAGGIAPSGRYELRARATDPAGNVTADLQAVTLDRAAPQFAPDHPDTVQTVSFPVVLTGKALDEDRVAAVTVSYDSTRTFGPVDFMSAPDDTVQYIVNVTDPAPQPGRRLVVLRATDSFGHVTDHNVTVAYDTFFPSVTSTRILGGDGTVADGDSLIIETEWNAAGLTVRGDFTDLDNGTVQQVTDEGGGRYLIRHRVLPTNTRPPGTRRVVVSASTGVLAVTDTLFVQLVDLHGESVIAVDRNRFDPMSGDKVTIAGSLSGGAVKVEVFDLAGRRVRVLTGIGYVEWDGRNEEGSDVASGVYLLRVRAGSTEDVRKVAVVRGGGR